MYQFFLEVLVLLRKEILGIHKDKRNRVILVMPVLIQTFIFGYVATFDLNNVEFAVLDQDRSSLSRELISYFEGSPNYIRVLTLENSSQIANVLDNNKALMIVHIESGFERKINSGQSADVQVLVDGRNSNVSGTVSGYASSIVEDFNSYLREKQGISQEMLNIEKRAWFNPNLETRWNITTGMLALLSVIQIIVLAGQTVAIEREQGTFDQLLVTPLHPITILIGKALPPVIIGIFQATIVLAISLWWFNIPFAGSYLLLFISLLLFDFAVVGIGLCISVLTSTMQQALLYSFTLLMPMILLSGFLTPISSMPQILQIATLANPVRYGVELTQRIYMEGSTFSQISHLLYPLGIIALITLSLAASLFRKRIN